MTSCAVTSNSIDYSNQTNMYHQSYGSYPTLESDSQPQQQLENPGGGYERLHESGQHLKSNRQQPINQVKEFKLEQTSSPPAPSSYLYSQQQPQQLASPVAAASPASARHTPSSNVATPPLEEAPRTASTTMQRCHQLSESATLNLYYEGETQNVVDEHFAKTLDGYEQGRRDLSQVQQNCIDQDTAAPSLSDPDASDNTPLIERNLPASFWDQNYKVSKSSTSFSDLYASTAGNGSDPLTGALHQLAASCGTDWHYSASTGQPAYSRTSGPHHHYNYNYWSRCLSNGADYHAAAAAALGHHHHGDYYGSPHHHYSNIAAAAAATAGLEHQESSSKELYWHTSSF